MTAPDPKVVAALRRVIALSQEKIDLHLADALYELLLATPVLVPFADGPNARFVTGPSGEVALPVFLDEASLLRGPPASRALLLPIQEAARIAMQVPKGMLVMDLGSQPGNQPIGRKGVELLAQGTYPGAERHQATHAFVAELAYSALAGLCVTPALIEKARGVRVVTIGSAEYGAEVSPGVFEVKSQRLQVVRGTDGEAYCVGWPTPGPACAFMPDARLLGLSFDQLARAALAMNRGLVISPESNARVVLSAPALATMWRS